MNRPDYYVSMPPHIHAGYSTCQIMRETILALIPPIFAGWFFFGLGALKIVAICAATAVATEAGWQKATGRRVTVEDGSALITGILLGLLLTPELPWWMAVLGAASAILLGKQFYGGLGQNPFSSVIVGWAIILISYGAAVTTYPMPEPRWLLEPGGYLEYSPLDSLKMDGVMMISEVPWIDLFYGNVPGAIGTTSVLAVLIGGAYLFFRRIITWHIPIGFIAGVWIFAFIFWKIDPEVYANPTFHILSGWTFFSAVYLAGERGSAPVTVPGMIAYGIGCGVLTMVIRIWGTYAEGAPFAILLMNTLTPLLDRIRPRVVGRVKEVA